MIFTIGYSNRSIFEFAGEIENREITQLVDVRSSPWSRNPHFNQDRLASWAEASSRLYRWDGGVLGGRSALAPDSERYRAALTKLMASASSENVVILCAEGEPENCHRCFDIGLTLLLLFNAPTINIRRDGTDEPIASTIPRLSLASLHPTLRSALQVRGSDHGEHADIRQLPF